MKSKPPLVQFYDDHGLRTGYLISIRGTEARVQPIGAKGTKPKKITVNAWDLRKVEK